LPVIFAVMADAPARGSETLGRFDPESALAVLRSIGDSLICTDQSSLITFMNPVAEKLTGWSQAEAIGRPVSDVLNLLEEDSGAATINPVNACLRLRACYIRESGVLLRDRSGNAYDIGLSAAPIMTEQDSVAGCVILFNNVTEIRADTKRLAHSALHDALTGLPNRTSFMTSLRQAIRQAHEEDRVHVLCFIDLDRFKRVNDKAGHAAGDALLAEAARAIARACASKDIAARLGGDEFGLLIRDSTLAPAQALAESIVRAIRTIAFGWEGHVFRIGASIGATTITRSSPELGEILHEADKACYAAKESGRNRVCIYDHGRRPPFETRAADAAGIPPVIMH